MSVASPSPLIGYDRKQSSLVNKKLMTLPRIEHPSKRMNEEQKNSLDIRGRSRDSLGNGTLIRNELSTPESPRRQRRASSLKNYSKPSTYNDQFEQNHDSNYTQDQDKVRLPVFGRRADSRSSSFDNQRDRGKETPRTSRIIIDELETSLREKVRSQLHDVRAKFRHAAQNDSNGKITRQALQHLIATIFGPQRQISPNHIDKLLERLNLKHADKISFDEFLQSLLDNEEELPEWMSRQVTPRQESSSKRTATQMFLILKEKVRNKNKDLVNLVPAIDGGPSSRIFKAQFHNALMDMGYRMKPSEFDKLWDKFDTDGYKAIQSEKFLKILTNEPVGEETYPITYRDDFEDDDSPSPRSPNRRSSKMDKQSKTPRLNTSRNQLDENQIQKWLNHKFPNGYSELEKALDRLDLKQMGTLPRDRFLEELKRFGLKLEPQLLEFFLKKLNVDLTLTNDAIPYKDVINAFKEKSDPTRKRINADNHIPSEETRQTALEKQIDFALSMNYERVRDLLYRLDTLRNGTVSINEIRSIIEDLIDYILKPDEYYQLLKKIPLDDNQRVKYKEYLKQVLDRTLHLQEQEQQQQQKSSRSPRYEFMQATNVREKINAEQIKQIQREKANRINGNSNNEQTNEQQYPRSIDELREMLKTLIRNRSKDIEDEFKKIDRGSYGELTPDLLYELFKRLSVQPVVTRAEVDLIFSHCHLKRDGNLDFYQFLREFGYSKRSAHYPNAKRNPPKRGDADFILTSNKLYGDTVLVHGAALNLIRSKWDQLRREFTELDPYRTGYVQSDEFDDILTELCPAVNQDDLQRIKQKFQTPHDSRMNYVRFLKHHAPAPELIGLVDEANRTTLPAISEKSPRAQSDRSLLNQVLNKIRRKLLDSHKQLRRTFKEQDTKNSGTVPVKSFRDALNQYKCSLNDEEFYTLVSQLDTKMDGTINYNYFLQQYVKNN